MMDNKKTAICFSGELRSIDITYSNIKKNIIDQFDNPDIFIHLWKDDPQIHKLDLIKDIKLLKIEDRLTFPEKNYHINKRVEVNIQGLLRQLYCLKECNTLKSEYEKDNNFIYDIVVRIRPDILIEPNTYIEKKEYDLNKIYIPNHDHHHGYNDRFYFSSSKIMDLLNNRFDLIDWYFNMGGRMHYETLLKFIIEYNGLKVEHIPLRFGLLRIDNNYMPAIDGLRRDDGGYLPPLNTPKYQKLIF